MPILTLLMPIFNTILGLIPDPAQRAAAQQQVLNSLQAWDAQQADVDKVEAGSASLFVSGWRPCIGWVCSFAVAYQYVIIPFGTWLCTLLHLSIPAFPKLDDNMWQLTFGMLGMSGLRSFDKLKGLTK